MEPHSPAPEGVRIYNLFPLLAGPMDRWGGHMRRAADMGFNWVFINSFHYPGFSGSLYAVKDYYRIHPLLQPDAPPRDPLDPLRSVAREARDLGLGLIMDLIINHTAVDALLVREHPDWFARNADGSLVHPSVWEGDRQVAVWGDLAEVANRESPDRENLWRYWEDLVRFYRDLGFQGFRCDAAYQVDHELWKRLISSVKATHPNTLFLAETLGCEIEDVVRLARAGFDYTFNSSKYWDFEAPWCLAQYRESAPLAPSVSFPESHDTPRLFEELQGDVAAVRQRYLFAALFSTGVMMPMGFEFGFRKRLDVVETRPEDWEEPAVDLRSFIASVHALKKAHAVWNEEGPVESVEAGNPSVLCLRKRTLDGAGSAWILLNKDRRAPQCFTLDLPAGTRQVTPGAEGPGDCAREQELAPSGFQVWVSGSVAGSGG